MVAIGSKSMMRGVAVVVAVVGGLLMGDVEGSLLAQEAVMGSGVEWGAKSSEFCVGLFFVPSRSINADMYDDHHKCIVLSFKLGPKVTYPSDPLYKAESATYWSLQESLLVPACRLTPTSPSDVSVALLALSKHNCPFAIRSGGHMTWAGAANIQDGVTIDMGAMNGVEVDEQAGTVRVGAGARWRQVYRVLDNMGLGVSGGRAADVGVAGLIVGGVLRSSLSP
jgi:hypothetical protein